MLKRLLMTMLLFSHLSLASAAGDEISPIVVLPTRTDYSWLLQVENPLQVTLETVRISGTRQRDGRGFATVCVGSDCARLVYTLQDQLERRTQDALADLLASEFEYLAREDLLEIALAIKVLEKRGDVRCALTDSNLRNVVSTMEASAREAAALAVFRSFPISMRSQIGEAGFLLVTFADGGTEQYAVPAPSFTDGGINGGMPGTYKPSDGIVKPKNCAVG